MMDEKENNGGNPLPPHIKYSQTGELEPIHYDWIHIFQVCKQTMDDGKEYVLLPVMIAQHTTKKQRTKLVPDDKNSPRGLIIREGNNTFEQLRETNYPYEIARFEVEELALYAGEHVTKLIPV